MHIGLITLLLFFAAPAAAQQIHKCIDEGQISYQDQPCRNGLPAMSWDVLPAPAQPPQTTTRDQHNPSDPRHRRVRPAVRSAADRSVIVRNALTTATAPRDRCVLAKNQRAIAYDRTGLKRSFQLSSHWDNRVQQACW